MAYQPYYAPYYRPTNYYNPSIPQENPNLQGTQPFQQQTMPMQTAPQFLTNDPMIWVLSKVEAESYPVAPNNSVILWDKNDDVVYIKSVSAQGVPSMRVLDYTERTAEQSNKAEEKHDCKCGENFVAKVDFAEWTEKVDALREEFEEYKSKNKAKNNKTAKAEEEHNG